MKQETIEEAAEKATNTPNLSWENEYAYNKFLEGAKWQQERSYSEEEVEEKLLDVVLVNPLHITMLRNGYGEFPNTYELTQEGVNHIVKQFKK